MRTPLQRREAMRKRAEEMGGGAKVVKCGAPERFGVWVPGSDVIEAEDCKGLSGRQFMIKCGVAGHNKWKQSVKVVGADMSIH